MTLTPADELKIWGPRGVDARPLLFWEVEVDGDPHWVAARDAVEAVRVAVDGEAFDGCEDDATLTVRPVDTGKIGALIFYRDDGTTCPMVEEFKRHTTPGHIASPDW